MSSTMTRCTVFIKMFHQTFSKYPHVVKLWLQPRVSNTHLIRTFSCRAVQQSSSKHVLTRITQQQCSCIQLTLVRNCFRYNKSEVTREILLYKYSSYWLFRLIGVFMLAQGVFWTYLLYNSTVANIRTRNYVRVKFGPEGIPEELKNWTSWQGIGYKMSSGSWPYVVPIICVSAGTLVIAGSLAYCRRNLHAIVLKKGGENVTFYSFGFLGRLSSFTVPLSNISAQHSRHAVRQHLPIKVKGHLFHYLIDKDGKYYNVRLFDSTIGVHRNL